VINYWYNKGIKMIRKIINIFRKSRKPTEVIESVEVEKEIKSGENEAKKAFRPIVDNFAKKIKSIGEEFEKEIKSIEEEFEKEIKEEGKRKREIMSQWYENNKFKKEGS